MRKRQPDLFDARNECPHPWGEDYRCGVCGMHERNWSERDEPEEIREGLGLAVPFSKSRELVKLELERVESDRREPRDLTLDGRDEIDTKRE
jgi:hypothetical protein